MKPLHKLFSSRQLIPLGMLIPAVLLIIVGGLQWKSVRDYRASLDVAVHTREVLLSLESFLSCMNNAETGQRGYLLTHKEGYLAPYEEAVAASQADFRSLRQLTASNSGQQQSLDRLEPLMTAKFQELAKTIALEKNLDHDGALKLVSTDAGENTMEQIRAILRQMHGTERALLQQREAVYQQTVQVNANFSLLLMVLGLGFVVAIILMLRRMERMAEMIKICAWSKMIEFEGEWLSIEEYLTRRLHVQITHGISQVEAQRMLKLLEDEKLKEAA